MPRPARNLQKVAKLAQSSQELKRPNPVMHLHAGKTGDNGVHALYLAVALEPRLGPNLALLHQLEVWLAQKNLPRSKVLHVMLQRAGKSGVNGHHVLEAVEQLVSNQGPGTALLLLMVDLPAQLNLLKLRTSTVKPTHAVQQVSK